MSKAKIISDLQSDLDQHLDPSRFPDWDFHKMNEVFRVSEEIFKTLTPEAVVQLTNSTNEKDLNTVFDTVLEETYGVLYGKHFQSKQKRITGETFGYLDKLTASVEETLRCENLIYFITSVLPDFELGWHHLEWCEIYQIYKRAAIEASRDHGKCLDPDTDILMFNGSIKKAKEIKVGDLLMGPDSKKRKVLSLHTGEDEMYKISQYRGKDYIVNSRHTLTLFKKIFQWDNKIRRAKWVDSEIVDIDLKDYLKLSPTKRNSCYYGFKVAVDYKSKPDKQNHKDILPVQGYNVTVRSPLKVKSIGIGKYVGFEVDGDKRFLLGDNTVTHNSYLFSNAIPAWNCYRFKGKSGANPAERNPRGFIFSFSIQQAIDLLEILQNTIEDNDALREKLFDKNRFGKTDMRCLNKARVTVKGFGSSVRGAHPGWIIIDDPLKDNVLFSKLQREKSISYLHSVIMNMIVPGGPVHIVGTPFHAQDIYGDLKTKKGWKVFEYPGIFPDGRLLWPNRWNYEGLMQKKEDQGNLIFSREILCRPISSDSTIFPLSILNTALYNMDGYTLVQNRESYRNKFKTVVIGCDFAISGSVGADYTVFMVWGIDDLDRMWLMQVYRDKGASYAEQLGMLKRLNIEFKPELILCEQNTFQQIFVQEAERAGLPVMGHTTTARKNDLKEGLPGLAILFERGKFRIPTGDQRSKDFADELVLEFTSVAYTDEHGLQATSGHDDICMASWISVEAARALTTGGLTFNFDFA